MFIAEVLAIHADEKYINEKGAFDISKCNLIAYSNGGYYLMGKKIGKFGFSVQKNKINNYKEVKKNKLKKDKYSLHTIKKTENKKKKIDSNNIVKKHNSKKKRLK